MTEKSLKNYIDTACLLYGFLPKWKWFYTGLLGNASSNNHLCLCLSHFLSHPGPYWASKIDIKHARLKQWYLFMQGNKYWIFSIRMKSSRLHWIRLDLVGFRNFYTTVSQFVSIWFFLELEIIGSLWKVERSFSYLTVISWANFLTNHEQFSKLCKKANISQQSTG